MNDNDPPDDYVDPEWAWEIVEKHDLALRADNPLSAARVLVADAGRIAQEIYDTAFREQALTPSTKRRLREVIDMLTDAERMSTLCNDLPIPGIVTTHADGSRTWKPAAE